MPIKKRTIRRIKIIISLLALIVLIFFIYSIINYSVLKNEIEQKVNLNVERYGYIAVFILVIILEASPQPFVSALVPFINAIILGLNFKTLLLLTILGAILSSYMTYTVGIFFGEKIAIKITGEKTYNKYHRVFKKYGKFGMTLIALTPIPYFPIIAGLFKMKLKDFTLFAVLPRIIHFLVFGYFAYLLF